MYLWLKFALKYTKLKLKTQTQARFFEYWGGLLLAVGVEVHLHGEVPGVLQVLQLVLEGYAEAHRPVISAFSSCF